MEDIPLESRAQMRSALRQASGQPVAGLIVAIDKERIIGTVEIATKEMAYRPGLAEFRILRPMGIVKALRYLAIESFATYKPAPREAYLHNMAIDPDYRRRGLALKMTSAAEEQARRYGKKVAVILISCENKASLALVEKCGYHQTSVPTEAIRRLIRRDKDFVRVEKTLLPLGSD